MFEVKGWSITAALKTQTGPVSTPTLLTGHGATLGEGALKKRKRKDGETGDVEAKKAKKAKPEKAHNIENNLGKSEKTTKAKDKANGKQKKKDKRDKKKIEERGAEDQPEKDKKSVKGKDRSKKEKQIFSAEADRPLEKLKDKKTRKKEKDDKKDGDGEDQQDPARESGSRVKELKTEKSDTKRALPRPTVPGATTELTSMQASMQAKLASARFRRLNETLYTSASGKALNMFKKNPEMFDEYHSGFRQQVDVWPENPVDSYIADIRRRGAVKSGGKDNSKGIKVLPRTHGTSTIADLGCGDAKLASELQKSLQSLQVKILSFDLHSPSPLVQRADIANLPLADGSVNIAIFCLALMGTNWPDFVDEAYRILHWKGELWVAEIKSRFGRVEKKAGQGKVVEHSVGHKKKKPRSKMSEAEKKREDDLRRDEDETLAAEVDGVGSSKGNDETNVSTFVKVLVSRGFLLDGEEGEAVDRGNKMFVKMRFLKAAHPTKGKNAAAGKEGATWKPKGKKFVEIEGRDIDEGKVLKPCVYKLR